jgi:hypothetical protein
MVSVGGSSREVRIRGYEAGDFGVAVVSVGGVRSGGEGKSINDRRKDCLSSSMSGFIK